MFIRNETERRVACLRFVDGKTQEEIASIIGVSQGRVSQICSMLLDGLRQLNIDPNDVSLASQAIGLIASRAESLAA